MRNQQIVFTEPYVTRLVETEVPDLPEPGQVLVRTEVAPITGRYDAMMLDFAAMVRGEKENPFGFEHELAVQRATLVACGVEPER